jgi:protocatechuate 3,4-dioxygenase beta subunit
VPEATVTLVQNVAPSPTPTLELIGCDRTLTPAQAEGPFYTPNTPARSNLVEAGMGGTPLLVTGKVIRQDCEPMAGVMLDFWQTDDKGEYDNVGYRMRGHQFTDENGNYRLDTILPVRYPGRTPHIHVKVFASDGKELLTTQIYFSGTSEQIPDGIFRPDLLARELEPDPNGRRHVELDFVLSN